MNRAISICLVIGVGSLLNTAGGQSPSSDTSQTEGPSQSEPIKPEPEPAKPNTKTLKSITNSIGMKLVLIPAGEFLMGAPKSEKDRGFDEKPHRVRLTKSFYMQTTEVTQGQWKSVMGTEPWKGKEHVKEDPKCPATHVSWHDAVEFCQKLSAEEGQHYRLPTEAEWEWACRAGATTAYSFGGDVTQLKDYAWYSETAWDVDEKYAHEVASKRPNSYGLYDMHGNVFEWCQDYFGKYPAATVTDPSGRASGRYRLLRGGCWGASAGLLRSARRYPLVPGYRISDGGFRCAQVQGEPSK